MGAHSSLEWVPIYRTAVSEANYFNSGMVVSEAKVLSLRAQVCAFVIIYLLETQSTDLLFNTCHALSHTHDLLQAKRYSFSICFNSCKSYSSVCCTKHIIFFFKSSGILNTSRSSSMFAKEL